MVNFLRVFFAAFTVTLVAAAVTLFFYTDRQYKIFDKTRVGAKAAFTDWEKQSSCIDDPRACDEYSIQFRNWMQQLEFFIEAKEQKPQFQYYRFLKDLDEQYVSELKSGGLASLGTASALLLLFVFSIVYLMGGKKNPKTLPVSLKAMPRSRLDASPPTRKVGPLPTPKPETSPTPKLETQPTQKTETPPTPKIETPPTKKTEYVPPPKTAKIATPPDGNSLLRKATDCAETEPMQAISYLEQALEGSLGSKLSLHALLLCGSLRLKNKIGEDKGREQLQQVISSEPESEDAAKAKTVLETFQ